MSTLRLIVDDEQIRTQEIALKSGVFLSCIKIGFSRIGLRSTSVFLASGFSVHYINTLHGVLHIEYYCRYINISLLLMFANLLSLLFIALY